MIKKKADISVQFSWIFIIIAGALIIIFFTSLIYKQKSISEQALSASVLNQLETIFTGAGLSSWTTNILDTPELNLNFICDDTGYSEYSIKGTSLTKEIPYEIVFAPESIKGRKVLSWTLDFNAPFKVANFLYLSDPNVKYVFVNPELTSTGMEIKSKFPEDHFTVQEVSSLSEISSEGYHTIRIVFFDPPSVSLPDVLQNVNQDVSAVLVTGGTVTFYSREGSRLMQEGEPVPYIDTASAYGAIFSKDLTFYECTMKKSFKKLRLSGKIYSEKESNLRLYFQNNPGVLGCGLYYQGKIASLAEHAGKCSQNLRSCTSEIISDIGDIKSNQDVLIRKTCPLLY